MNHLPKEFFTSVKKANNRKPKESTLETKIVKWCKDHGLLCIKVQGVRGFPDRMIMNTYGRIFFLEIKRPGAKPRANQTDYATTLHKLGFTVGYADSLDRAIELLTFITAPLP